MATVNLATLSWDWNDVIWYWDDNVYDYDVTNINIYSNRIEWVLYEYGCIGDAIVYVEINASNYNSVTLNYSGKSHTGNTSITFGVFDTPEPYAYNNGQNKRLDATSGSVTFDLSNVSGTKYVGFYIACNTGDYCDAGGGLNITSLTATTTTSGYNLTYNANNGSGAPSSVSGVTSTTISSTIPYRFGYTFKGWNTYSSATTVAYRPGDTIRLSSNTTLYAVWQSPTVISSTVTSSSYTSFNYFGDGCEFFVFTPSADGKYRFESDCGVDPQISIYNTGGSLLAYDNDGTGSDQFRLDYNFTSGTKYYIKVSFYEEEIAEEVFEEEIIAMAYEEIAEEVVEEIFEEVLEEEIEEEIVEELIEEEVEEEIFEEVLEEEMINFTVKRIYTITYNANGGSNAPSSQTKIYNETLILSNNTPTKNNCTFLGWATSSSATSATYSKGGSFTANEETTLYAVWKVDYYYIEYNANGGSGGPSYQKKTNGTDLTLSTTIPIRFGYTFLGWNTYSYATTAAYVPGGTFTNNKNTILYAVWESATEIFSSESNSSYSASIPFSGGYKFYSFTPSTGGKYRFESNEGLDPRIYLYDSDGTEIAFNDDGAGNLQFRLDYNFTSGVQYYIKVKHYSSYTGTINFTVKRQGLVYICDSTGEYSPYQALIYDGSNWNQCEPYIYNGSSWDLYS